MNIGKLFAICILLLPLCSNAGSVCQVWSFSSAGATGVWSFTGGRDPGSMVGNGFTTDGSVTQSYSLVATVTPMHKVFVQRRGSTDNNSCDYNGIQIGNEVTGTFICTSSTPTPQAWSALISEC